jgi:hypothetical protein
MRGTREGFCSHRPRTPTGIDDEIAVPAHGRVGDVFCRHARSGLSLAMSSRVSPPAACRFDPASGAFAGFRRDLAH